MSIRIFHFATLFGVVLVVVVGGHAAAKTGASGAVFPTRECPTREWATASPESQELDAGALERAAAFAIEHGGGSGCIIRRGFLVKEWGDHTVRTDIKSATKGSVGTTVLGLAVDAGLVKLDDQAQTHYPKIGIENSGARSDWLGGITVRHLATMTAGFDDGRPPQLARRPGSGGQYSNDTSNMLAELLTLRFNRDLRDVFKEKVMDVIGAEPSQWAWRDNSFRAKSINGLKSREFASGITITHRALARIGYLYLREGLWNGERVLSGEFIREATQPTDLPAFVPYYAFYWGSNGRGTYAGVPKDTYWALGLGDSFVVVCPSLDIVAVRLGVGSNKSRLPGDPDDTDWGKRVEGFFSLVAKAAVSPSLPESAAAAAPYPPSEVIRRLEWSAKESIVRRARGSDNWPITWADDDALYTAYGDGNGFEPFIPEKLSLGFAKVTGDFPEFSGTNFRSPTGEARGEGSSGKKASGILCVDGVLHVWMRNAGNSQLASSPDHGATWNPAGWKFTESFGCPAFLNFGRNYAGARDEFVYIFSPDANSAYETADGIVLARVPKDQVRERKAYEFFAGRDESSRVRWSPDLGAREPVFVHRGGCYRLGVTYNSALKRYLLVQPIPGVASRGNDGKIDTRFAGGLGIHDAPEPWGPWTTVFFTERWDVGPGESASFPTKWMSEDGTRMVLVFSGDDCFSAREMRVVK